MPCSFPFIYNDEKFSKCTDFNDPDNALWCSTRTNPRTKEHIRGNGSWGYCQDQHCPNPFGNTYVKANVCLHTHPLTLFLSIKHTPQEIQKQMITHLKALICDKLIVASLIGTFDNANKQVLPKKWVYIYRPLSHQYS